MGKVNSYSIKQVAAMLEVSCNTVRRLIYDGSLRAFRVRSVIRVTHEALTEYQRDSVLTPEVLDCGS